MAEHLAQCLGQSEFAINVSWDHLHHSNSLKKETSQYEQLKREYNFLSCNEGNEVEMSCISFSQHNSLEGIEFAVMSRSGNLGVG